MIDSIQTQIDKVRTSIANLEAQRGVLGDETVNTALSALNQQLASLEKQTAIQSAPTEERRMVTILFIDMVGSTGLAEKLDPEEWRQIVQMLHTNLGEVITNYHGSVAQFLGDGLLAFFGSQEASEHDPENAIRAALDAHATVTNLPVSENVQLRAGIHTGLVVVGELGDASHKEFSASGDAMNLAARLQSAAPPGGTLISHDTYRYVRGVFDLTPQPPLTVKGKSEPLQTYLVRRAKPRPFRSVSRGVAGIETRTIGREQEMQALQAAYLHAYEGHGKVWTQLLGEPGVGKTRLLVDLTDWMDLREEVFRLLRARAFPDDANQPYALVRRMWFDRFLIAEDAPLEIAQVKWVDRFKEFYSQEDSLEAAHALGLLVGLPFENSPYIKGMRNDPTQVKGRALVVSRDLIKSIRQHEPLVVLLEDLQWTDASSWEYLIEVLLETDGEDQLNGLFIIGAARPEWQPPQQLVNLFKSALIAEKENGPWGMLINLPVLTDESIRELGKELLQRTVDIPEQVIDLLVERSEGIPYFTEEIVNWFIDHEILDTRTDPWTFMLDRLKEQPLPTTLQHLLFTRLSSLSQSERAALQRGSIFGRRFWSGGVEALGVSLGAETLSHLQPRGFVEAQPESAFQGDTEWSFHHSLLQEVTYESVLKRERAALHKIAATWLEQQAHKAGRIEEFAGLLGDHYERAGDLSTAADWYLLAGRCALNQGAPREAKGFYTQALDLLPPVDRERRWKALLGRENSLSVLGDVEPWQADLDALLELAQSFGDDNYLAEAYLRQAQLGFTLESGPSDFAQACQAALAAAQRCSNEDIEAKALAQIAVVFAYNLDKDGLIQNSEKALHLARCLQNQSVLSYVLFKAAFCYSTIGDVSKFYALQTEQIELDHLLGDRFAEAKGMGNMGSLFMTLGLFKQARQLLEQSIKINEALGAHPMLAYNLGNLGEIYLQLEEPRRARQYLEQALREITSAQDAWGMLFIVTQIGLLYLSLGDSQAAAKHFQQARQLGLNKGLVAQAYEATAGLAACAVMQGRLDEARAYVHDAWDYLKSSGWSNMEAPGTVYRTCVDVFEAVGETKNAMEVLYQGYQALIQKANTINVPEWRQSFLQNVPDNRALVEMWERNQGQMN